MSEMESHRSKESKPEWGTLYRAISLVSGTSQSHEIEGRLGRLLLTTRNLRHNNQM